MKTKLYCYHGEKDGIKKIAIPRMYGGEDFNGEYDIYSIEIEKNENDIRGIYVLKHDIDAIYNKRDFGTKKYCFNSICVKNPNTLKREIRMMIIELENKSALTVCGKIVSEHPIQVENGIFKEIGRNYIYNDSINYIQKMILRYYEQIAQKDSTVKSKEEISNLWKEEPITLKELGLESTEINFLGEEKYSNGSNEFLGYMDGIGLTTYHERGVEQYITEYFEQREINPIFAILIAKDKIKILVDAGIYSIKKEGDWKLVVGKLVKEFCEDAGINEVMILQQIEERKSEDGQGIFIYNYILNEDTIYKEA